VRGSDDALGLHGLSCLEGSDAAAQVRVRQAHEEGQSVKRRVVLSDKEQGLVEKARELEKLRAKRKERAEQLAELDKQIEACSKAIQDLVTS
jgi:hypothetical protein